MFVSLPFYTLGINLLEFGKNDSVSLMEEMSYDGRVHSEIDAYGFCNFYSEKKINLYRTVWVKFYNIEGAICDKNIGYIKDKELPIFNQINYKKVALKDGGHFYSFSGNNWVTATIFCSDDMFTRLRAIGETVNSNLKTSTPYQMKFDFDLVPVYKERKSKPSSLLMKLKSLFSDDGKPQVIVHNPTHYDTSPAYIEKMRQIRLDCVPHQNFSDFLGMKSSYEQLKNDNFAENKNEILNLIEQFNRWLPDLDAEIGGDEYKMLKNYFREGAAELRQKYDKLHVYSKY